MMRSIQSVSDKVTLLQKQVGGKIASIHYRLNTVRDSIDRMGSASVSNVRALVEKTQAAVFEVQRTMLLVGRTVHDTTGAEMTIGEIVKTYKMRVADFIKLNPGLARMPRIPAGTVVVHYAL